MAGTPDEINLRVTKWDFERGEPVMRLVEDATGKRPENLQAAMRFLSRQPLGNEYMRGLAGIAVAVLRERMLHGCRKSAEIILQTFIHMAEQPIANRVQNYDLAATVTALYNGYKEAGMTHDQAIAYLEEQGFLDEKNHVALEPQAAQAGQAPNAAKALPTREATP